MATINNQNFKLNKFAIISILIIITIINPFFLIIFIIVYLKYKQFKDKGNSSSSNFLDFLKTAAAKSTNNQPKNSNSIDLVTMLNSNNQLNENILEDISTTEYLPTTIASQITKPTKLERKKKYLHIALNNSIGEARNIIQQLPSSDRILIEVGTPMIKRYGTSAINMVKNMSSAGTYIVADNKCADLASREVEMMANAGANASTCLGVAPIETIDSFIEECQKFGIDSMIDMMNVENPLFVLKKLKKTPTVVILHRGVDETEISKGKQLPLYQIKQIKGNYNIMVAVAGGDTIKEIKSAIFNDADIVVVWKNFYQASSDTAQLAKDFLKEI
ncbi:MAG: orotidine 5'-phosphate decarboxylase / HUMPS family protein [Candidatus Staskawiczbacteria bacterium]